jgi:hypothetical protein
MQKQSYLEKQEMKKSNMLAAGLVSERYPSVSTIVLHMTYYQRTSDPILMKRTLNFLPTDYACFHLDCMREECANGGFELSQVIAEMIKKNIKSAKGKIVCTGKSESLHLNHASISYEISIQYLKQAK